MWRQCEKLVKGHCKAAERQSSRGARETRWSVRIGACLQRPDHHRVVSVRTLQRNRPLQQPLHPVDDRHVASETEGGRESERVESERESARWRGSEKAAPRAEAVGRGCERIDMP